MKQQCKGCQKEYELTDNEIKWFEKKGLVLPKRCTDCRKERKVNTQNA